MLEIKNGRVGVGVPELTPGINFTVGTGEMFCISGRKGSGKTSLLRAMMGLQPLISGFVTIDGDVVDISSAKYFRQQMSYIPQDVSLPFATIDEMTDVLLNLKTNREDRDFKGVIKGEYLKLGMSENIFNKKLEELSPSQVQLVLLCAAVVLERPYLLMDELQDGEAYTDIVISYLRQYASSRHALIIVSNDENVRRQCNKSLLMDL